MADISIFLLSVYFTPNILSVTCTLKSNKCVLYTYFT